MRTIMLLATATLFATMAMGLLGAMSQLFDPPPPASPFYVTRGAAT
jgi:hypothetical protein